MPVNIQGTTLASEFRNAGAQLLAKIGPFHTSQKLGVCITTMYRAIAGGPIMPNTMYVIENRLRDLGLVPRKAESRELPPEPPPIAQSNEEEIADFEPELLAQLA